VVVLPLVNTKTFEGVVDGVKFTAPPTWWKVGYDSFFIGWDTQVPGPSFGRVGNHPPPPNPTQNPFPLFTLLLFTCTFFTFTIQVFTGY
jgi:hypothetical protein